MKISCDIIKDLLPLYAEDMASEDTKQLVEEHLQVCEDCQRTLAYLRRVVVIPAEAKVDSLWRVKEFMKGLGFWLPVRNLFILLTVMVIIFFGLTRPMILSEEEAGMRFVKVQTDYFSHHADTRVIRFEGDVDCYRIQGSNDKLYFTAYKALWYIPLGSATPAGDNDVWLFDAAADNEEEHLYTEDNVVYPGGGEMFYVFLIAIAAAAVFGISAYGLRKRKEGKVLGCIAVYGLCLAASNGWITGFSWGKSIVWCDEFGMLFSGGLSLLMFAAYLCGLKVNSIKRKEMGA